MINLSLLRLNFFSSVATLNLPNVTEKEGLRQQQLLPVLPRHHKHYILPNSVNKKVHFSPHIRIDPSQQFQVKSRILPSGSHSSPLYVIFLQVAPNFCLVMKQILHLIHVRALLRYVRIVLYAALDR